MRIIKKMNKKATHGNCAALGIAFYVLGRCFYLLFLFFASQT